MDAGAALLRICANPDGDHRAGLSVLSAEAWRALVSLACEKRVSPLVKRAIARAGLHRGMPEDAGANLHSDARWHGVHALKLAYALARLTEKLGAAGMAPIALKGVRLACRDYPDPALRTMRDLDLLVLPEQAEAAQALLLGEPGYELAPWAGRYGIEYGHQLPELRDVEQGVTIEIHHRLNARGWAQEERLVRKVRDEAETMSVLGRDVWVPSLEANLLHIAEHATLHHAFENGPLTLADLHYMCAGASIDWPGLLDEAEAMGLRRSLALIAGVALRHGAVWVPDVLRAETPASASFLDLSDMALLQSRDAAMQQAMLRRLEQRSGAKPGWRGALGRVFRPDPYQLAKFSGRDAASSWRWLGYPAWLASRGGFFIQAMRDSRTADAAIEHSRMQGWLRESGPGSPHG
jgi:hypothetical protein